MKSRIKHRLSIEYYSDCKGKIGSLLRDDEGVIICSCVVAMRPPIHCFHSFLSDMHIISLLHLVFSLTGCLTY